jgi:hypothetical protein
MFSTIFILVTVGLLAVVFSMPPRDHYGRRLR